MQIAIDDRKPIEADDELVVICCPDPPSVEACRNLVVHAEEVTEGRATVVMFNPRLVSGTNFMRVVFSLGSIVGRYCGMCSGEHYVPGDVGIGNTFRQIRREFLGTFETCYSLQPLGNEGSIFKKYPGMWQIFKADPEVEGRFLLVYENINRPQVCTH